MDDIEDGIYDVIVVDCQEADDGGTRFEVAFTAGPHKGDVVHLRGSMPIDRGLSMLGVPARLAVDDGRPRLLRD